MPRIPRMLITGKPTAYHIMSRSALDGYCLGDVEKEHLFQLIRQMSSVYLVDVLGFCIMGNHFHLLIRMLTEDSFDDEEIIRRFRFYYGPERDSHLSKEQIGFYRKKWSTLSEYVKDIKQRFSRFYNKRHNRRGFFWADRFKSVIVEDGDTLINCLAYIDLNPVRAGLCKRPEEYRWNSLGCHYQAGNRQGFLSLDFGLGGFKDLSNQAKLAKYREFVYEKAGISEEGKIKPGSRLLMRTRYFTDSAVIGTKDFVSNCFKRFKHYFTCRRDKRPVAISGLMGIYSLKRLTE